jgi:predicted DNA-binding ribbon-helix-helix protein
MEDTKPLTLRLKKSTWVFLKKKAVDREMSLAALINERLEKYKNKCEKDEKSLTSNDTMVS